MKTLNEIKKILTNFFEQHAQINSTYYLSDDDYNTLKSIDYSSVNITYKNSNITGDEIQHNYDISISDLAEFDNSEIEDYVHSNCILIIDDFFTFLDESFDFEYSKNSTLNPFIDDTADRTAGITFSISIQTERRKNICDTPTK
jgi:hypothetical protein